MARRTLSEPFSFQRIKFPIIIMDGSEGRLWENLTAEKVRRHRERSPCRNSISKRDFNCQPTILIISRDRPAHTLHKRPGDRQSQSC